MATDSVYLNITPQDDATFAYSARSYCSDDSDPTPTITGSAGGTFSSTTGLVMTNGVIDLDASTAGTYTIKYLTPGTCPDSSTQDLTITTPSTDFNYGGDTVFCQGSVNPVATITGDTAGIFTSSSSLVIDSLTGEIDLASSIPGNHQVTYTPTSKWQQIGPDIEGEAAGDLFGWSTSLNSSGNRVAIGGYFNDDNGVNAGHTRIFEKNGSSWTQLGQDIDGEFAGDAFGFSTSINSAGNVVAIGGYANDGNGGSAGHVRVYILNGSSWVQIGQDIDGEASLINLVIQFQ